jgi:carboxypeptidase Taq
MDSKIQRLKTLLYEVQDLRFVADVLEWEQQTYMPPGGVNTRAEQFATVRRLAHEKFTADEIGQLLEDLAGDSTVGDYDSDEASLVRYVKHEFDRLRRVPVALEATISQHKSYAQELWIRARAGNDFEMLQPALEKMFDLKRQYAEAIGYEDQLYDPLFQDYEPGIRSADVAQVFAALRAEVVPLVKAILPKADSVSDAMLYQSFDPAKQRELSLKVSKQFGFDYERGRLDEVAHPFCVNFSRDDVRLTTRFKPDFLNTALFGTMHETGHGLYEQGISPALHRLPLSGGASMALHESQSRLWENLVGRSRNFWKYFYPTTQATFPQLASVDGESFYRAVNRVSPSLIRIEADELTYSLHIMLRFELERELLEGKVRVADLPEAWRAKMWDYVGVVPETDTEGVLQDVHWSAGLIGYFATYALGTIISVQLYEAALAAVPDIPERMLQGDFSGLLGWLQTHVYQYGRKYKPMELLQKATGQTLQAGPYVSYLRKKFGEIYNV